MSDLIERIAFTIKDASKASSISERMLWRYIENGELKVARIGKHRVIVPKENLLALIAAKMDSAEAAL